MKTVHMPTHHTKKLQLLCSITALSMSEVGEVSQCIRLELAPSGVAETNGGDFNRTQKNQQSRKNVMPIPQFHFRFDSKKGKFVREVPALDGEDISKNSAFMKWRMNGTLGTDDVSPLNGGGASRGTRTGPVMNLFGGFNDSLMNPAFNSTTGDDDLADPDDILLSIAKDGSGSKRGDEDLSVDMS
jgi:hypothetical protein